MRRELRGDAGGVGRSGYRCGADEGDGRRVARQEGVGQAAGVGTSRPALAS